MDTRKGISPLFILLITVAGFFAAKFLGNYNSTAVTISLIIVNAIVCIMIRSGKLDWQALSSSYDTAIAGKDYSRIVTAQFTHVDTGHIFMNMLSLWNLGSVVEPFLGSGLFYVMYMICIVIGGLVSVLIHGRKDPGTPSVGASGAIYGIFGMYIVFAVYVSGIGGLQGTLRSILLMILMSLNPRIDSTAHFCGFFCGIAEAILLLLILT